MNITYQEFEAIDFRSETLIKVAKFPKVQITVNHTLEPPLGKKIVGMYKFGY